MILQVGLGLENAAQNFIQSLFNARRLEQAEQEMELAERQQDLREQKFEQALAEQQAAQQNAFQNLLAQQQAQGQQIPGAGAAGGTEVGGGGGIQSPVAQDAFQQAAQTAGDAGVSRQAAQTARARLPAAAEAEEQDEALRNFRTVAQAAQGQQVDELPTPDEFEEAANQLGVPAATRTAFRERVFATPGEEREQAFNRAQDLFQIQALGAVQGAIQEGASITDLARSNDPQVAVGAGLLGGELGTQVRQLRNKFTDEAIDNRKAVRQFWRGQAQSFIEERGLQGRVGLQQMTSFLRGERDDLPEEVEDALGEELEQFRNSSRLAARAASAGDVNELPTMQVIDSQINAVMGAATNDEGLLDPNDEQTAQLQELFNQKIQIAEQELGIPRDDPAFPFPSAITEEDLGEGLFNLSGQNFQIVTTSEGRALNRFISAGSVTAPRDLNFTVQIDEDETEEVSVSEGDTLRANGNVDRALQIAAIQRALADEDDKASFTLLIDQLRGLKEAGVDRVVTSPQQ